VSAGKPVFLVTGNDLAREALALLGDYEVVYAGKTPTEDDIVALCKRHDPVAIIVRYSKVGAAAMEAAPSLKVISKHWQRHRHDRQGRRQGARHRGRRCGRSERRRGGGTGTRAPPGVRQVGVTLDERMRAGHWDKATHKSVELEGRTIGLIGLGAIGLRFAAWPTRSACACSASILTPRICLPTSHGGPRDHLA
jgi:D-3-phosphoglycerate dehydrogenase